jgi:hypothetical protein
MANLHCPSRLPGEIVNYGDKSSFIILVTYALD